MTNLLKCKIQQLPITYLGISPGSNPKKVSTWKLIVEKVEKRLTLWKTNVLSRAGRLTLIKVVLNNLSLIYLSIFKIPKKVVVKLIQL